MSLSIKQGCYSDKFDKNKEPELKSQLEKDDFTFKPVNYAFWGAKNSEVNITLYKSGKILIQGKNVDNYVSKYLNVSLSVKTEETKTETPKHNHKCWIGTDESGKGDYFGPLVVAGVMVDENNKKILEELGVKDSKKINDATIEKMAFKIKANSTFSVVTITPNKYNQIYSKFKNLNSLLAWGHARAIENVLEKKECNYVISDKFGNETLIQNALMTHGRKVELEQRVRAEDDIAVAAASILARNEFVQRMKQLSKTYGIEFSKGASPQVKTQAREFINKYGKDCLNNIAKLHFKTTQEL